MFYLISIYFKFLNVEFIFFAMIFSVYIYEFFFYNIIVCADIVQGLLCVVFFSFVSCLIIISVAYTQFVWLCTRVNRIDFIARMQIHWYILYTKNTFNHPLDVEYIHQTEIVIYWVLLLFVIGLLNSKNIIEIRELFNNNK